MNRKIAVVWLCTIITFSAVVILVEIAPIVEAPTIIYVDDEPGEGPGNPKENYTSIQDAINASSDGDTVFVYNGTYYENVVVNKTINLTGEDRNKTIIDGGAKDSTVVITVTWVNLTGFMITGSGISWGIAGIGLSNVQNVRIFENNISYNNYHGIFIYQSQHSNITNNIILSNEGYGISMESSSNIKITNNYFIQDGIEIFGYELSHYNSHDIPIDNMVNGIPLHYYKNCKDIDIDGIITGQLILANCSNVQLRNSKINNTDIGIGILYSTNVTLINNNLDSNHEFGIFLSRSSNSLVMCNNVSNNGESGIGLGHSSYNNITGNYVFDNNDGITLGGGSNNYIIDNNITRSGNGIRLGSSSNNNIIKGNNLSETGIYFIGVSNNYVIKNRIRSGGYGLSLYVSPDNKIIGNDVSFCGSDGLRLGLDSMGNIILNNNICSNGNDGIYVIEPNNHIENNNISSNIRYGIFIESTSNNYITGNTITNNNYGLRIQKSSNNHIYHNNIIDNTNQAYDMGTNFWNDTYPSGGNYWSDYTGIDLNSTAAQNVPPPDGIGDTPYTDILGGSGAQDYYPLMHPYINGTILFYGWNLISIPLIQSNTNLGMVLNSIEGSYDAVQWYNVSDNFDPWKHNSTKKPFHLNDLENIYHTNGFWIHITEPDGIFFEFDGSRPIRNQTIALHPGWNIAGYPSLSSYNRTYGLNNLTFGDHVDAIWTYDSGTQKWEKMGESDYFKIGRGYYIHAKTKCEWEVPL
ncbi:MAG: right-handed parallel beta-helix repeat-containing protein [Thermoplasmata archaeon]|nr:MAG: right-handed parallel beta-helix repeat-containing protein [Thermoplasmata archaeon]